MSLIIGKDSYITLEEANTYIQMHYMSSDSLRISWEALDTADREIALRNSFVQINRLPFTGRPADSSQSLPFPRYNTPTSSMYDVKCAQVENAVQQLDKYMSDEIQQRKMLQRAGVKKYMIGDLSEEFVASAASLGHNNCFGLCPEAYEYLKRYLQGGYKICTSIKRYDGRW